MYGPDQPIPEIEKYKDAQRYFDLNRSYWDYKKEITRQEEIHQTHIGALRLAIAAIQSVCPHPTSCCEHVPDPWSSYYTCNLCGKDVVRPTICEEV
jgi:hypothetical protein